MRKRCQRVRVHGRTGCARERRRGGEVIAVDLSGSLINIACERLPADVPDGMIKRVIQFARQGFTALEFDTYDTDWDSEAYLTVSGQNSNNSVRVADGFLQAVENDADWNLTRRLDGKVHKTLKARDLWDKVSYAAWACADPGIQFHTSINDWHTCPAGGEIRASNPCSEYMFLDDTACNLASMNLLAFRKGEGIKTFDVAGFEHATWLWTMVLESSRAWRASPSRGQTDNVAPSGGCRRWAPPR